MFVNQLRYNTQRLHYLPAGNAVADFGPWIYRLTAGATSPLRRSPAGRSDAIAVGWGRLLF